MFYRISTFLIVLSVFFSAFFGCTSANSTEKEKGICTVDPNSKDFGNISVGNHVDFKFEIKNTGTEKLKITSMKFNFDTNTTVGEFAIESGWNDSDIELLVNDTHDLSIRFEPVTSGAKSATLEIKHNGEDSPTSISLTGQCMLFDMLVNSSTDLLTWNTDNDTVTTSNVNCGIYITSGIVYENCAYYTIGDWMGNTDGVLKVSMNSNTSTGFTSSTLTLDPFHGANPLSMAIVSPVQGYVVNGNQLGSGAVMTWGVTEIDPSANPPVFKSVVAFPNQSEAWSPEGCAVFENKLFVACTGFDTNYFTYRPGAIFVLNTVNNNWIDADPSTPDIDPIITQTVNPRYLTISPKGQLYAICSGDYASANVTVEVFDPTTFASLAVLDLGQTGGVGIPAVDAQGRMYIPDPGYMDAVGGKFYSIDTNTNTVLRDATDKLEIPGNVVVGTYGTGALSCTIKQSTNMMYFSNYFDPKLYIVDLSKDTNTGALPNDASREIDNVAGASGLNIILPINSELKPKFADTVVSYDPAMSFNDPTKALDAPEGAGASSGSLDVVSIEFGKYLILEVADYNVIDGPGFDFVVYENAFNVHVDGKTYGTQRWMEPAKVSVSSDGVNWTAFPATENSLYANDDVRHWEGSWVGIAPVMTSSASGIRALDWSAGGDRFDLADISVAKARYIKIEGVLAGNSTDIDALAFKNYQKR